MLAGSYEYIFLNKNLFLAFLPWLFTTVFVIGPKRGKRKLFVFFVILSWLAFFPNAPYILTDLFHLRQRHIIPLWFDLILILSFAWTGLLFGFFSLWDIEMFLKKELKLTQSRLLSVGLLFVAGFGIYLGRYLRWNSWDIVADPLALLYDIGDRFIHPFAHPRTWGMTLFMGTFLNILYWSFRMVRER